MRRKPFFPPKTTIELHRYRLIPVRGCGSGKGIRGVTNAGAWWSVHLPTFYVSDVCHIFLHQRPGVSVTMNVPPLRCADAEARLFCADRGSSLIRAWPLWLAVQQREAAWRYNTRPSRCTKTSIISWSPQEVALDAGSWYYCCLTWILTSTVHILCPAFKLLKFAYS